VTPGDLLKYFRSQVFDAKPPYLWQDDEVWPYMDDAQKMFCRLVQGIPDATSEVTKVKAVAGKPFSSLNPRLLKIRKAYRADFRELMLVNLEDVGKTSYTQYDYGVRSSTLQLDARTGPLETMVLGMEVEKVRWIPVPAANETVTLIVDRLPLESLCEGGDLEIQEQHHIWLVEWMRFRAYNKQDSETYDKTRGAEAETRFRTYCAEARSELERLRQKSRAVQYGGIPMR
jgi:hypothetical protein